ncbi:MAG: hypothetical protein WBO46_13565 [Caldilineaceae bacterium]
MRQMRVALVGSLFLMVCTTSVVWAEGESPTVPVPEGETAETVPGQQASPLPEAATPVPEPWRAVVNNLNPNYWDASLLPVQGVAMYYNPGVFQQVLDFRFAEDHITECAECIGYVALLRAGDIDRRVWLQREDRMAEGPFWVVDVAARKDIPGLLDRNWVVDIDHKTAMRWRMAGPIPITVYADDSPEAAAFSAAYFSSEMVPLDERHVIPPGGFDAQMQDSASKPIAGASDSGPLTIGEADNLYADRRFD